MGKLRSFWTLILLASLPARALNLPSYNLGDYDQETAEHRVQETQTEMNQIANDLETMDRMIEVFRQDDERLRRDYEVDSREIEAAKSRLAKSSITGASVVSESSGSTVGLSASADTLLIQAAQSCMLRVDGMIREAGKRIQQQMREQQKISRRLSAVFERHNDAAKSLERINEIIEQARMIIHDQATSDGRVDGEREGLTVGSTRGSAAGLNIESEITNIFHRPRPGDLPHPRLLPFYLEAYEIAYAKNFQFSYDEAYAQSTEATAQNLR